MKNFTTFLINNLKQSFVNLRIGIDITLFLCSPSKQKRIYRFLIHLSFHYLNTIPSSITFKKINQVFSMFLYYYQI